ncbi:MAG: 4Fe-4S dicluster domain-containing protein [Saccharofermentanales bacterium]|jgi:dihydroorotate dehydrogenase/NAD-dependent dihydropyrimidine dehydrogenase PreA subunit
MSTTEFIGLKLKNPIIVASGPWAGSADGIQRCIDAGAAAVITETISLEAATRLSPRLYASEDELFNIMLYSKMHLEEWEEEFPQIDRGDAKVIGSIWGATPSEIAYMARKVEQMGADGIEISLSAPIGARNPLLVNYSPDIYAFVQAAVRAVDVPVTVKLSYEAASSPYFLSELERAGIRGVSAIDALKGLEGVDLETQTCHMPTYGGYTGHHIRPIALATTAALHQYTNMEVASSGGVVDYTTVLEHLMLGAKAVQLASVIQLEGYGVITRILDDLNRWLEAHDLDSFRAIRGKALASLRAFEDIVALPQTVVLTASCDRDDCRRCIRHCLSDAVSWSDDRGIVVDPERCDGCGLCVARCPREILKLRLDG